MEERQKRRSLKTLFHKSSKSCYVDGYVDEEEEEEEQAAVKKNAGNSTIRGNIGCLLLTRAIALAKHTARNAGKRVAGWGKKEEGGGRRERERGKEKYPNVRLMRVYFTWNWTIGKM